MKSKFLILIVSLVLVLSAGMAVYSYATVASNNSATTKSSGALKWSLISPEYNSNVGVWVANVSGWQTISVNIYEGGTALGGDSMGFVNSLSNLNSYSPSDAGGCINQQGADCELNSNSAQIVNTVAVQGELVVIYTNDGSAATISIYATTSIAN